MRAAPWVTAGLAIAIAGCAPSATELVVVVDTDYAVPRELDEISVTVTGPDGEPHAERASVGARRDLPLTLGVAPQGDALGPIEVVAVGTLADTEIVRRRHRVTLVRGESRMLVMHLARACMDGARCGGDETCTEHGCRPIDVDGSTLPRWGGTPPRIADDAGVGDASIDAPLDAPPDDAPPDDAAPDAPDAPLVCAAPTPLRCGTECVDPTHDARHCTACDTACAMPRTCWPPECGFRELMHWIDQARMVARDCGGTAYPARTTPLVWSVELERAAAGQARQMAMMHAFDFTGANDRATAEGYMWTWINPGAFQMAYTDDYRSVVDDMMATEPALCAQVMSAEAVHFGASAEDDPGMHWYVVWYLGAR